MMYSVIKDYCENEKKNGLFLMDLPTGFGKTHNVIQYIFDAACDEKNKDKKFFFITNLKKNLPEKQLRKLFEENGRKEEFDQKFLYLNSNAELAIDGYSKKANIKSKVPSDIWQWDETKFFFQDLDAIIKFRNNKKRMEFYESASSIENTFATKIEPDFRHKVERLFKNEIKNAENRRKAVESDPRWMWLGDLYESTKTYAKQIIILSAKKFVTKNSTIVDSSYLFYTNDIMNNAVVFIDEFDAAKKDFLDNIIEDGIREQVDFIDLFLDIHTILQTKKFQKEISRKSDWYSKRKYGEQPVESIIDGFKENADQIFDTYNLACDIRTPRDEDLSKQFLFQDSQYHTITKENKFISISYDDKEDLNVIHLSDEKKNSSANIQMMLSKIRGFVNFFQIGVTRLAHNLYRYRVENHIGDGDFTLDAAVSSILKQFRLKDKHVVFLKNQILQDARKKGDIGITKDFDLSFFVRGLRYYAFTNDVMDDLESVISMFAFNNTPEKILLNTCQRAKVVGISATATIPTSIGNFDLTYMREQLGSNFQEISEDDRARLKKQFYEEQKGYEDVDIVAELLGRDVRGCCDENSWSDLYGDPDVAHEAFRQVCDAVSGDDNGFHKERYYRIVQAYKKFFENDDIHSFLCILTTHPREDKGILRKKTLIDLFTFIDDKAAEKVQWLTTEDFDKKKQDISERLTKGEKCFVISAYATIGAGQNLQYDIPSKLKKTIVTVNNCREKNNEKDYDAIYLDNPTYLLINTNKDKLSQKEFVTFLFQIEYLLASGEIPLDLAMQHIRKGFDSYATQHQSYMGKKSTINIYDCESVKLLATRNIIQAVGRMCRTNHKSQKIYLFADSNIAENLDCSVIDTLILNHEFKKLLDVVEKKQNRKVVKSSKEQIAAYKSVNVNSYIQSIMNEKWTEISVDRWKTLRDFVLKYPTASKLFVAEKKMSSFYAEFEEKVDHLYFGEQFNYKRVFVSCVEGDEDCSMVESESNCRLDRLMSRPEIKQFFIDNGYATRFEKNDYIMVPTMYNNIYKGALGEVVGRYIFGLLNIELEEITDLAKFEKFDFMVRDSSIYIDFKHWNFGTDEDRDTMIDKIASKAEECGTQKVIVVNVLDNRDLPSHLYKRGSIDILAVPALLIDNGNELFSNKKSVEKIRRFVGACNDAVQN